MGQFDQLEVLARQIAERKREGKTDSYTVQLLQQGLAKCAQKFGEEAFELGLASVQRNRTATISETADVLYHLLVLLESADIQPEEVMVELKRREGTSGLAEKAARPKS
jgi:phosphoribosyl-ATP pyrophosphohydrolase